MGRNWEKLGWRVVQGGSVVGITVMGLLALQPVRAPELDPQPLRRKAAILRQLVARQPENGAALMQLARVELATAQVEALRGYGARFPETQNEAADEMRMRYDAWLRGYLHAAPCTRQALMMARRAAALAKAPQRRAEALVLAGSIAWQRGDERVALSLFRAACHTCPTWRPAWIRLGAAAEARGDVRLHGLAARRLQQMELDADRAALTPFSPGPARRRAVGSAAPSAAPSTAPRSDTPPRPAADS